ncbi:MAG: hypothetical protein ACFFBD_00455 [Candidatus Hodarchaeota archaeon]
MLFKLRGFSYSILLCGVLFCLLTAPTSPGSTLSAFTPVQISFAVNEIFLLNSTQSLSYQFPFKLNQVGFHACVRIQGGVLTGQTPTELSINITLDGLASYQSFSRSNGLQKHYTFHSSSEYVVLIPPPIRPSLDGIQTVHTLTVELAFTFSSTPDGLGVIHQIIFETFTPPTLNVSDLSPIILVQDEFSWRIGTWSFGTCFFNTTLLIPLTSSQDLRLTTHVELTGLTLDGWQLFIEQGASQLQVRDNQTLQGVLTFDPTLPCELRLVVDPPQVSEPALVNVSIEVQGLLLPAPEPIDTDTPQNDPIYEKRLIEGLVLIQLGLVIVPLSVFYRIRRPILRSNPKEEN